MKNVDLRKRGLFLVLEQVRIGGKHELYLVQQASRILGIGEERELFLVLDLVR